MKQIQANMPKKVRAKKKTEKKGGMNAFFGPRARLMVSKLDFVANFTCRSSEHSTSGKYG